MFSVFLTNYRNTSESLGEREMLSVGNTATQKRNQIVYFDHQNVNTLCLGHHYVHQKLVLVLCFYEVTETWF